MTYALLLLVRGVFAAQLSTLVTFYGRRTYERSRGVLMMMIHEKSLKRKMFDSLGEEESKKKRAPVSLNQGGGRLDDAHPNGTASEAPTLPLSDSNKSLRTRNLQKATTEPKLFLSKLRDVLDVIKAFLESSTKLFRPTTESRAKPVSSITTGFVLNLVRSDTHEVSLRFREVDRLIKEPLGLIIAIWLIWALLGPSCFLGILVIAVAQLLNTILTRLQIRWRRYLKSATDKRVQLNSQYLEVIRHLRWYAWQDVWLEKVMLVRQHELNVRAVSMMLNLTTYFLTVCASGTFPVVAFIAYTALSGNELRIDLIFPALKLFEDLKNRLKDLPNLVTCLLNGYVSLERIDQYMDAPEIVPEDKIPTPSNLLDTDPKLLVLVNCTFCWPGTTVPVLRQVSLRAETGLTLIFGRIGSGKTALLQALLGELDMVVGHCELPHTAVGYCSQTPWLQDMSIRENILFYSQYEEQRYRDVLDACALMPDIATFAEGDQSLIGEKWVFLFGFLRTLTKISGITLSGGQRARVALARAMYSKSRVLLLDDPLAALDHNTAHTVVTKCFSGPLAFGRVILLVTHSTQLVHHLAIQYAEVFEGTIKVSPDNPFSTTAIAEDDAPPAEETNSRIHTHETNGLNSSPRPAIKEEGREQGGVKAKVWLTFIKAGKFWWILLCVMMVVTRILGVAQEWFLKAWGEGYADHNSTSGITEQTGKSSYQVQSSLLSTGPPSTLWNLDPSKLLPSPRENLRPWILVLLLVTITRSFSLFMYAVSQLTATYATSKFMFAQAMEKISHATFGYYDITPTGQLMNRMTADISVLGEAIHYLAATIFSASHFVSSLLVISTISMPFLLLSCGLVGMFVWIFSIYLPTSRGLKRLEAVCLSPLFTAFGEILRDQGVVTVRAFCAQRFFHDRAVSVVDQYQSVGHFYWSVQTWISFRYENIAAFSTFTLIAISLAIDLSPGMTAFMLVNASAFIESTPTLCRRFGDLQTEFISVERLEELLRLEQEPIGTVKPPAAWPRLGSEVVFENVTIRYGEGLEPSLRDITLHIPGGSTTAITGRTGSGKSTLVAALLKIVRPEAGSISIDNLPLKDIDVNQLRRRVTFVPQDPVLFVGSIRQNLDPIEEFTDNECETVLAQVTAGSAGHSWDLNSHVESGGKNLSQGQRQLIGITRAILRRSAVVILDEATASIDVETSKHLQRILREELKESTIITIAHRADAVENADYIVVLENGRVLSQSGVDDPFPSIEGTPSNDH